MNASLFCGQRIHVSAAQGEIPEDAVEMWRRKRNPVLDEGTTATEEGGEEQQRRPRNSWGDDVGPPPEADEAPIARELVQYDDEEFDI